MSRVQGISHLSAAMLLPFLTGCLTTKLWEGHDPVDATGELLTRPVPARAYLDDDGCLLIAIDRRELARVVPGRDPGNRSSVIRLGDALETGVSACIDKMPPDVGAVLRVCLKEAEPGSRLDISPGQSSPSLLPVEIVLSGRSWGAASILWLRQWDAEITTIPGYEEALWSIRESQHRPLEGIELDAEWTPARGSLEVRFECETRESHRTGIWSCLWRSALTPVTVALDLAMFSAFSVLYLHARAQK